MKLTPKQKEKYDLYRSIDWEFYEQIPASGLVCLRKERWYGTESVSFEYITIKKDGSVVSGNLCERAK